MESVESTIRSRPLPPPKPEHLSVAFTGTLNSDAFRDYIKAQSTGGSTWSKTSDKDQDGQENGDQDVFGTARLAGPSPSFKASAKAKKVPLRDMWAQQNQKQNEDYANIASVDSDGESESQNAPHSRYVSTVSTIKPSPSKFGSVRGSIAGQGTIKGLPVTTEDEAASEAGPSGSITKWLAETSSAQGTLKAHHDRQDASAATVRPVLAEPTPDVQGTLHLLSPDQASLSPYSLNTPNSADLQRPFSVASSAGITSSAVGERSRAPSILSRPDTGVGWEMQDHVRMSMADAEGSPMIKEDVQAEEQAEQSGQNQEPGQSQSSQSHHPTPPAGRPARALYPVQGEAAFNELSLSAGQTFRILNEELQGGWSLAIVQDPNQPGQWIRGLVPRGWYALEREMAPPPPAQEEVAASRQQQDEGYLAPVTVQSSNINAVAEPVTTEDIGEPQQSVSMPSSPPVASQEPTASALFSVSHFLNQPSAAQNQQNPSNIGSVSSKTGLKFSSVDTAGTTKSIKRQTRATAALSQLMAPSLSAPGGSTGSWFKSKSADTEPSLLRTSTFLKPRAGSHISPQKERKSPALPPLDEPELQEVPETHAAAPEEQSMNAEQAVPQVSISASALDDVSQREPTSVDADFAANVQTPTRHRFERSEQDSELSFQHHPPASPSKLTTPFYRTVKRYSPFVTSGAEAYLLSRELSASNSNRLSAGDAHVEVDTSEESADGSFVRLEHSDDLHPTAKHEIVTGPQGELRWKECVPPVWVEIHSPAYIENPKPDRWLRLTEPGFVVYQITTRTCEADQAQVPLDPVLVSSEPTSTVTVSRRFKHFSQLSTYLTTKYPLLALTAIPPFPVKSHSKRFDATFLEARRRELWNWLERITRHPLLRKDVVVNAFLTVGGTHGHEVPEGEEGAHEEWESWINEFQTAEQNEKRAAAGPGKSLPAKDPAVEFFAHTFHPEFAIDREEVEAEVKRAQEWTRAVESRINGTGPETLLKAAKIVREDMLQGSRAYREMGRSLLRATTGAGGSHKAVRNEVGGWCWREGCTECVPLTRAVQSMSDTLQDVAQLHDEQARYHLMPFHERLWNTSQPHATAAPLFDLYRSTLDKYALALKADASASPMLDTGEDRHRRDRSASTGDARSLLSPKMPVATAEHLASGSETVLNVLQSELQHMHDGRLQDWRKMGSSFLDEQIGFYEEVLGKLRQARVEFNDEEWQAARSEAIQSHDVSTVPTSAYVEDLSTVRPAPPPPLPQPAARILPSSGLSELLRPVGLAGEVVLGIFGGGGGVNE